MQCLPCARHCSRCFAHIKSLDPHNHHMRSGFLIFPFYRWENWGTQRLAKWLKIVPVSKWWGLSTVSWVSGPNSNDNTGQGQSSATAKTRFPWPPSWGAAHVFLEPAFELGSTSRAFLSRRWACFVAVAPVSPSPRRIKGTGWDVGFPTGQPWTRPLVLSVLSYQPLSLRLSRLKWGEQLYPRLCGLTSAISYSSPPLDTR